MEPLRKLSAAIIYAFLVMHMANHYAGLGGVETHIEVMNTLRLIYRHPIVECLLFLAFVVQLITGVSGLRETWAQKKGLVHQLRAISGLLITAFVFIHVTHLAFGRLIEHTDTNFYYVATGFATPPKSYIMMTIYGIGLMALFMFLACSTYDLFKKVNEPVGYVSLVFVLIIGGASTYYILQMLRGELYPLDIPETYTHILKPETGS